jgi:hypothetical protein
MRIAVLYLPAAASRGIAPHGRMAGTTMAIRGEHT